MGINHLPEISDYLSKDEKLHYSPVADRISRRQFEISRYLHFAYNTTPPAEVRMDTRGYKRSSLSSLSLESAAFRCLHLEQKTALTRQ